MHFALEMHSDPFLRRIDPDRSIDAVRIASNLPEYISLIQSKSSDPKLSYRILNVLSESRLALKDLNAIRNIFGLSDFEIESKRSRVNRHFDNAVTSDVDREIEVTSLVGNSKVTTLKAPLAKATSKKVAPIAKSVRGKSSVGSSAKKTRSKK